ncbi:hypothetical protein A3734_12925 [Sulfitobacter sp. HI0054]|uniref:hypothetical protein n=1 Tax=Sulfitobacter sp. HI0054 TaxID=1822238 RepID=UPI0007C32C8E|nr:hypothetical protein [Sulfitobacter sp. HI0054]KZY54144.1 hypothetical protein A3734_12925 [Sulfitobacter sp. HI0054]
MSILVALSVVLTGINGLFGAAAPLPLIPQHAVVLQSSETKPLLRNAPQEPRVFLAASEDEAVAQGAFKMGIGLASVADWSAQQPFLDVMKTARPWLGHLPGQFGGMEYEELLEKGVLDGDGWPLWVPSELGSIGTVILTDMPAGAKSLSGRYRLAFDGGGIIEVRGRAERVHYKKNVITFDYEPGPGLVDIRIQQSDPADPVRNITVIKEEHLAAYAAGSRFNPYWIDRIRDFKGLRFMDWMGTNHATLSEWHARPKPNDFTYAQKGVPVETQVALANELSIDPWFNVPHLADDAFVRAFAEYVKDNLDPNLKAYVEFSNEVWNWQFSQARWADEQALARWGQKDAWVQYYALRATQVAQIWSEVFSNEAAERLVNVISTQTGWIGLEQAILNAPLWQAESPGAPIPAEAFDAYAVTGYLGGVLGMAEYESLVQTWLSESLEQAKVEADAAGLRGEAADKYIVEHRYDRASTLAARDLMDGSLSGTSGALFDLAERIWPYHAQVARTHGLDLIVYEGGTHIVGIGPQVDNAELTAFMQHFNYSPEMGRIYRLLLRAWGDLGGGLFAAYNDVYAPTKWGSWGGLRHLDDHNPRWDALISFQ